MKTIPHVSRVLKLPTVLAALLAAYASAPAAPPAQFSAWGSACPPLRPVPAGWKLVENPPSPLPAPTAQERELGYQIVINPGCGEGSELRATAAQGEYEPVSFVIHALAEQKDVTIHIAPPPEGGKTNLIHAEWADIRLVRRIPTPLDGRARTYRMEDLVLEKPRTLTLQAGQSAQVWITLHAPPTEGDYAAQVEIVTTNRVLPRRLRLRLHVLPFALPPAGIEMALFHARPAASDAMLAKELIDMREHGMTAVLPALEAVIATRDQSFGPDDVKATQDHSRRLLRAAREHMGPPRFPVLIEAGHQIAYYWDQRQNWFVFWPHSPRIKSDLFKALTVLTDVATAEGAAATRVYLVDEAAAHNLMDEAAYYYGLVKKRMPRLETWTTIGGGTAMGQDELGRLGGCVDFFATNRFTPQIARFLVDRGKPYGVYNGAGHSPEGARFFFGFYGWKTGASQISQWVYHFGDAPFAGNGLRQEDEGYVYHAADGPLPTLMWEAVREGVDDYRYVQMLAQLGIAGKASDKADAKQAAEKADAWLRGVLATIDWNVQALQSDDRTPPPPMERMQQWRAQAAEHVATLQALLNVRAEQLPQPKVSPFDYAWTQPAAEKVTLGEELLPQVGFEDGLGPWRVEMWKGQGKGTLDADRPHGGKQAVRIDVPAGENASAVTVLVWPGYGPKPFTQALAGGSGYELSAWVRVQGRATAPQLRLALPDGTATVRSGLDPPDAAGWQRLWVRAWPKADVTPKYLGVWVQGPGTVWVDDVSLRRIKD